MGTIGAKLSKLLINGSFGILAFGIPFLLFITGIKLGFKKEIIPIKKALKHTIPIMLWGVTLFGLVL